MADQYGIYVKPEDGGPAINMTADVRIPSFCASYTGIKKDQTVTVPGVVSGSQLVIIPHEVLTQYDNYPSLIPGIALIGHFDISGNKITPRNARNISDDRGTADFSVFQILPKMAETYGIRLLNSTNLLEVNDTASIMQPIWRSNVTINGSWNIPTVPGFTDKNKYIVFAHWTNTNCSLVYHKGSNIQCTKPSGVGSADDSTAAKIVIFYAGSQPAVSHMGINIFNAAGKCTFSSAHTPFLMRGQWNITEGMSNISTFGTPIAEPMVPLGNFGAVWTFESGNQGLNHYWYRGLRMSGQQIGTQRGHYIPYTGWSYTGMQGNYEATVNGVLPVLDAKNFL